MRQGGGLHTGCLYLALALVLLAAPQGASALDLIEIYQQALVQDPQWQATEAQYLASRQELPKYRASLLPSVEVSAYQGRNTRTDSDGNSSDSDSQGYGVSLSQTLYDWGAIARWRQAGSEVDQADARFEGEKQALMVRLTEAYFNLLLAQENLTLAQAEAKAIGLQLEQTKQRFQVGLIAVTDVHEAQAVYDLAQAQEVGAENELANSREAINVIIGRYPDGIKTLNADMPLALPKPEVTEHWTQLALTQNPNLQAARHALDAARRAIGVERGGYHPSVSLNGRLSHQEGTLSTGEVPDNVSMSVQLSLPLFNGGATLARVSQARYRFQAAQADLELAQRTTLQQTRNAFLGIKAGVSRVDAFKQAEVSTRSAYKASKAGLEVGSRTTVDVLNAQREVFRAQRNLAQARYQYLLDVLRLKQAVGTLALSDLQAINQWLQ